jgi:hydrogenase maturation protein HypF
VGFRPFVYRLATEMKLSGWVINSAQGVFIEVDGDEPTLREFVLRVERERPAISFIQSMEASYLDPAGFSGFEIRESSGGEKSALILPDISTCPDCLREVLDPANRRYRYPFTNCTNCGPRFTIIESLPYDRPRTTMKKFAMCPECDREYHDPADRRFHAQPNACSVCGPHLELWAKNAAVLATHDEALRTAAAMIRDGKIVAVKGLGGFHLMVDARNEAAVIELRRRKGREEKPFALMYPSRELVLEHCEVSSVEERLLCSPESPIVLLRRKAPNVDGLGPSIAPRNPWLGIMLPYTPLHHLLMSELGFPVIATSGNLSDEPICTDENEALERLARIADVFLVHNRPIVRHVDDSIVREMAGRELVLRRARGFAPLPVQLENELPPLLGVGAHQKNSIAASVRDQVFVSQHIGDLETAQSYDAFRRVIASFRELYELTPETVACDLHPGYFSTAYAKDMDGGAMGVQHHYAHALACMAENRISAPALAVTWDGSGFGPDNTVWGGEFLRITEHGFERVAHLRTFRLPGSEKAVKEPRRVALALLYEMFGDDAFAMSELQPLKAFTPEQLHVFKTLLERGLNSPLTSSAGRLFDGVASLIGLRQVCRFEGQAAMELEFSIPRERSDDAYRIPLNSRDGGPLITDWEPMLREIIEDIKVGAITTGKIAQKFHNALAGMIVDVARKVGEEKVVLTGGCFQNRYLTECAISHITNAGFKAYWHQRIPPNDGGISLGQIVAVSRSKQQR